MTRFDMRPKLPIFFSGFIAGLLYLGGCGKENGATGGEEGGELKTALVVKANGSQVGQFASITNALYAGGAEQSTKIVVAVTTSGYLVPIRRNGEIDSADLYYEASDCTGAAYTRFALPKSVFKTGNDLYYVSPSASETDISYESIRDRITGNCTAISGSQPGVIEATSNVSATTGLSQASFTPPITIE